MELGKEYAVSVISQQDNHRPLKTKNLQKISVLLKHI